MSNLPSVMSFGDHLEELRTRLVWTLLGMVILFVAGLVFGDEMLTIVTAPLIEKLKAAGQPATLLATSPVEAFGAYIKVAFIGALLVGLPWALYQLWLFIAPGLLPYERRFVYFLLPMSTALTGVGIIVLYFVLLPLSLFFLIHFGAGLMHQNVAVAPLPEGVTLAHIPQLLADPPNPSPGDAWINLELGQLRFAVGPDRTFSAPLSSGGVIAQHYRISEYINLVFMLAMAFAIAFQVPLVLMLLSWVGILEASDLTRYRKHTLFGCALGAALMPTQDPWSMLVLATCLYGLFEFGLILMKWVPARRVAGGLHGSHDDDQDAAT